MSRTEISEDLALKIAEILRDKCGWAHSEIEAKSFAFHIVRGCMEYRFMGALGFGGKFRNDGNHDGIPYVDCYQEHENDERRKMISDANNSIAELFANKATETPD